MLAQTKRIIFSVGLVVVGTMGLFAGPDEISTTNDDFVEKFLETVKKSPAIKFKNGHLKLWAKMSDVERRSWLIGTLSVFIPGLASLGGSFFVDDRGLRGLLIAVGIAFLIFSGIVYAAWEVRANKEKVPFPRVILDAEGIISLQEKKLLWQDVSRLALQALDYYNGFGSKVSEVRVLSFLDKYNNVVLQLDQSDMLPISVDNLVALAEHYLDNYKKQHDQQNGQVGSSQIVLPQVA